MSETTVTVRGRVRIQGRLKDPQDKWRDEITQEIEITSTISESVPDRGIVEDMARMLADIERELFANLAAAGGMEYTARQFPEPLARDEPMRCPQGVTLEDAGNNLFCEVSGEGDGVCEHRVLPTAEDPEYARVVDLCKWPGWIESQEETETEMEVIGSHGDIEIMGEEILKECPINSDDPKFTNRDECPINIYDKMTPGDKTTAELWMLNEVGIKRSVSCLGCPKYQKWNPGLGTSPEAV